jgi:hypothetical protein
LFAVSTLSFLKKFQLHVATWKKKMKKFALPIWTAPKTVDLQGDHKRSLKLTDARLRQASSA